MPLSDGLISTTGLSSSRSHMSVRNAAGASSPVAAGASAELERPSPVDERVSLKL